VGCAETPSHSHGPGNTRVRVRVTFTTGAVRSDILATAGLLGFRDLTRDRQTTDDRRGDRNRRFSHCKCTESLITRHGHAP